MTPKPLSLQQQDLLETSSNSNDATTSPQPSSSSEAQQPQPAVVIVTPYSTGCCLALEIKKRGYKLICVWSAGFSEVMKTHVPVSCLAENLQYDLVLDEGSTLQETAATVLAAAQERNWTLAACVCGGEAGVDLADALSERLGLRTNGTAIPNRRDKKVQQDLIHAAGLRSIRQVSGHTFEQVQDFLASQSYPVVVKPLDSAGSDGVKLCHSYQQAKQHVLYLLEEHNMVNGGTCHEVLCQEYLQGKEYVVDHVSRDGVHKTVMVWVYDKRAVNGASFVYFGDIPFDVGEESSEAPVPQAKQLIPYVRAVLDAMDIQNGPTHAEVILTKDGPCLVEMNCRANGGDGIWQPLCRALTGGYNQIDATADAYLDKEKFALLPDKPPSPFLACGQLVDLVSFSEGTVKATPGYDIIRHLPSFVCLETHVKRGSKVSRTVDLVTDVGTLVVMHTDKAVLEKDIALIRQLEKDNALFEYEEEQEQEKPSSPPPKQHHRNRSCSIEAMVVPSLPGTPVAVIDVKMRHRRLLSAEDPPEMYY